MSSLGTSAEDAVLNGKNGILVPMDDCKSATGVVIRILSDADLRHFFPRTLSGLLKV